MVSGCCKGQSQQSWDDLLRSKTELEKGASFENHAIHYVIYLNLQNSCSTTAHSDYSMDWPSLREFSICIYKLNDFFEYSIYRRVELTPSLSNRLDNPPTESSQEFSRFQKHIDN